MILKIHYGSKTTWTGTDYLPRQPEGFGHSPSTALRHPQKPKGDFDRKDV